MIKQLALSLQHQALSPSLLLAPLTLETQEMWGPNRESLAKFGEQHRDDFISDLLDYDVSPRPFPKNEGK